MVHLLAFSGIAFGGPPVVVSSVLTADPQSITAGGVGAPAVERIRGRDRLGMAFETPLKQSGCAEAWGVGLAHSEDGLNWTVQRHLLVAPEADKPWACGARRPALVDGPRGMTVIVQTVGRDGESGVAAGRVSRGGTRLHPVPRLAGLQDLSVAGHQGEVLAVGTSVTPGEEGLWFARLHPGRTWTVDARTALPLGVTPYTVDELRSPSLSCTPDGDYRWSLYLGGATGAEHGLARAVSRDASFWFVGEPDVLWHGTPWRSWDVLTAGPQTIYYFEDVDGAGNARISLATSSGTPFSVPQTHGRDCGGASP